MSVSTYHGTVEIVSEQGLVLDRAIADLWQRESGDACNAWGGVLMPVSPHGFRVRLYRCYERGERVRIRLASGAEGLVLFTLAPVPVFVRNASIRGLNAPPFETQRPLPAAVSE